MLKSPFLIKEHDYAVSSANVLVFCVKHSYLHFYNSITVVLESKIAET